MSSKKINKGANFYSFFFFSRKKNLIFKFDFLVKFGFYSIILFAVKKNKFFNKSCVDHEFLQLKSRLFVSAAQFYRVQFTTFELSAAF